MEQERKAFEEWAKSLACVMARNNAGYMSRDTDAAWLGWQARAALESNNISVQPGLDYILLDEGAKPEVGDLVFTDDITDRPVFVPANIKDWVNYEGKITIIRRNGKPVIYKGN